MRLVMNMQAIGIFNAEQCAVCCKPFQRGDTMSAAETEEGDPLGWFCSDCLVPYKHTQ